jgi:hypothetical protein
VTLPPAVIAPQFMEFRGIVHPLSEYRPKFVVVDTDPVDDKVEDVLRVAKVISVNDTPIRINAATITVIEILRFAMPIYDILRLNKYYLLLELITHLNN